MEKQPIPLTRPEVLEEIERLSARLVELDETAAIREAEVEEIIKGIPALEIRSAFVRGQLDIIGKIARRGL